MFQVPFVLHTPPSHTYWLIAQITGLLSGKHPRSLLWSFPLCSLFPYHNMLQIILHSDGRTWNVHQWQEWGWDREVTAATVLSASVWRQEFVPSERGSGLSSVVSGTSESSVACTPTCELIWYLTRCLNDAINSPPVHTIPIWVHPPQPQISILSFRIIRCLPGYRSPRTLPIKCVSLPSS